MIWLAAVPVLAAQLMVQLGRHVGWWTLWITIPAAICLFGWWLDSIRAAAGMQQGHDHERPEDAGGYRQ